MFDSNALWHFVSFHIENIISELDYVEVDEIKTASLGRFLDRLEFHTNQCKNVLVLQDGVINRNYSRCTSLGITGLQTIQENDYLPIYSKVPGLLGVSASDFAAHARRTWSPGGDGGRVAKQRPRR